MSIAGKNEYKDMALDIIKEKQNNNSKEEGRMDVEEEQNYEDDIERKFRQLTPEQQEAWMDAVKNKEMRFEDAFKMVLNDEQIDDKQMEEENKALKAEAFE